MNRCDVTTYCDFLFQSSWQWWILFFINLRQKKHFSSKFVPVFPWDKQSLCHPASPFYFSFVVYLRMLADHPAVIKEFLQGGGVASSTCLNGCLDIKRYRNGNSGALAYVWTPAVEKKKNSWWEICCSKAVNCVVESVCSVFKLIQARWKLLALNQQIASFVASL